MARRERELAGRGVDVVIEVSGSGGGDQRLAAGTSRQEIDPAFFQPSLSNHVLG